MKRSQGHRLVPSMVLAILLCLFGAHFALAEPQAETKELRLIDLPPGSASYSMSVPIANLLNEKTDLTVFLQSVAGGPAIPSTIHAREGEIGHSLFPNVLWGFRGEKVYKEELSDLRLLLVGEDLQWTFITYKGTNIDTIYDLKGKRVSWDFGPVSVINTEISRAVLEAFGIDPERDIVSVPADSIVKPFELLLDRRIDAGFANLAGASLSEFAAQREPVYLEIPADKAKTVQNVLKYAFGSVTPGDVEHVPPDLHVIATSRVIFTNSDLDDDTAYKIVKTIIEGLDELIKANHVFKRYYSFARPLGVPYHPGAVRYYREKGLWTADLEEQQTELVK